MKKYVVLALVAVFSTLAFAGTPVAKAPKAEVTKVEKKVVKKHHKKAHKAVKAAPKAETVKK